MVSRNPFQTGFTLIEVMIAVTIMAFLSIMTADAIRSEIKSKAKYEKQIQTQAQLRDALEVMIRDINLAFHYRDFNAELYNAAWQERIKSAEGANGSSSQDQDGQQDGQTDQNQNQGQDQNQRLAELKAQYKPKKPPVVTRFYGEEDQLFFTSLSNVRTQANQPQSRQLKVAYYVKQCRGLVNKKKSSRCLIRRTSPILDDDVTNDNTTNKGTETVLLEDVTSFHLRYLGPGFDNEWVESWKSDKDVTDDRTRSKFPFAVEITLGIKDPQHGKDKSFKRTVVAEIRFPNNAPPPTTAPGTAPGSGLGPQGANGGAANPGGSFNEGGGVAQ